MATFTWTPDYCLRTALENCDHKLEAWGQRAEELYITVKDKQELGQPTQTKRSSTPFRSVVIWQSREMASNPLEQH